MPPGRENRGPDIWPLSRAGAGFYGRVLGGGVVAASNLMTTTGSFNRTPGRVAVLAILAGLFFLAASSAVARSHVVRRGETLSGIASKYRVSLSDLMRANNLKSKNRIPAGRRLTIPGKDAVKRTTPLPGARHTVRKGETLSVIAERYGASVQNLVEWNDLKSSSRIDAGQSLIVAAPPANKAPAAPAAKPAPAPRTHVVRRGDTLSKIAERQGMRLSTLAKANGIRWPYRISIGQQIVIPGSGAVAKASSGSRSSGTTRIIVQKRETLAEIARRYGVTEKMIADYNGLTDPDQINVGQRLIIPGRDAAPKTVINAELKRALDRTRVRSGRWKYIVVHHSATKDASPKGMDAYHRARGMENGLAYHFVIGRGGQMQDGSTYVGNRWKKQLDGGHLAKASLNARSIGICLVGDFTKQSPSTLQMRSLNGLVDYLLARCRLKPDAVKTHRQIHPGHTACPGKRFPASSFAASLKKRN